MILHGQPRSIVTEFVDPPGSSGERASFAPIVIVRKGGQPINGSVDKHKVQVLLITVDCDDHFADLLTDAFTRAEETEGNPPPSDAALIDAVLREAGVNADHPDEAVTRAITENPDGSKETTDLPFWQQPHHPEG